MFYLPSLRLSGKEVIPIVEGGKGVSISTGLTSGLWAANGGVGTVSAVNADFYDNNGNIVRQMYTEKTREGRHKQLIDYAIKGGIAQTKIAHDLSNGEGRIHINVLWEMGAVEAVLNGILEKTQGLIHGITSGAGMPYKLAEIATKYKVYYYPIISSARAFKILYKRSFNKFKEFLGGVVYEDPWLAGGHIGLSNAENQDQPESAYLRVKELRKALVELSLEYVPIIVAGGVWWLSEFADWIDNKEIGPIAFQFGSRPLLTQESPISDAWKQLLLRLRPEDIILNRFSPTGFPSNAINNNFIKELADRITRQVRYSLEMDEVFSEKFDNFYISKEDIEKINDWYKLGFTSFNTTPSNTLLFLTKEKAKQILYDQMSCSGCLSRCLFSGWNQSGEQLKQDPRTFCIQKTLQDIAHNGDIEANLLFAGKNAYRFSEDPFYKNGFIPNIKQLFDRILSGF